MPSKQFIGRSVELGGLQQRYEHAGAQLILVYGRRRIGKSYLLEQFVTGKPTIFYQATQQTETRELAGFTNAVRAFLGEGALPPGYDFPGWGEALGFLSARSGERLVIILDEFPYLSASTAGLPSIVQRWWDQHGRRNNILLILCGSAQRFMEELDGASAPLHQRFTAKFHVRPLDYRTAALFTPTLSGEDKARVYAILGGTPLYLRQWNAALGVRANLIALFGDPASSLVDSAELTLSTDLEDARAPYRALQAVAFGATKHSEIRSQAKITTDRTIQRLLDLDLLEKRIPATENAMKSRRGSYAIGDSYYRFYFRFIAPQRGAIDRGFGAQVVENIMTGLDDYMGPSFEEIARNYARYLISVGELQGDTVSSWWSNDGQHEIDIVGTSARLPTFVGSVKWRREPLGEAVLKDLEQDAALLNASNLPRLLIGRGGVQSSVAARAGVRGASADDLYR
jgi:AAA+ ATPase superfamily predicted ATPase